MRKILFFILYKILLRPFLTVFVGVNFKSLDTTFQCKQFIIVANHNSHIDTVAILSCLPFHLLDKVFPVAAKDYFGRTKLIAFLSRFFVNALLVERRSKDDTEEKEGKAIDKMLECLDKGNSLIIFPEGTRGQNNKLGRFKKGVAFLLKQRPFIPFIPVYMKNTGSALPKGDAVLIPHECSVCFGNPSLIDSNWSVEEIMLHLEEDIINLDLKSNDL